MTVHDDLKAELNEALEHLKKRCGGSFSGSTIACDLDGTLIKSDLLVEGILREISYEPLRLIKAAVKTKLRPAPFKDFIENASPTEATTLPYRNLIIELLKLVKKEGATLILATGANKKGAERVADELNLFDNVIASTSQINLKGNTKADALDKIAPSGWIYFGDSNSDRALFKRSMGGLLIGASKRLRKKIQNESPNIKCFLSSRKHLKPLIQSMRPHQWSKNLLLFTPVIVGQSFDLLTIGQAILGTISFCAAASAVYILNDLLDLSSDRHHIKKRNRPFANGSLSLITGSLAIPILVILSILGSFTLHAGFTIHLCMYLLATTLYSFKIKRFPIIDVALLAFLYTWRIQSGGIATGVEASPWLLGFSSFFFLSLALAKRDIELRNLSNQGLTLAKGRGYKTTHIYFITRSGIFFAICSLLTLLFYINNSTAVNDLYEYPNKLSIAILFIGIWLARMWQKTVECKLDGDPVMDAIKEPISYIALAGTVISILLAS